MPKLTYKTETILLAEQEVPGTIIRKLARLVWAQGPSNVMMAREFDAFWGEEYPHALAMWGRENGVDTPLLMVRFKQPEDMHSASTHLDAEFRRLADAGSRRTLGWWAYQLLSAAVLAAFFITLLAVLS